MGFGLMTEFIELLHTAHDCTVHCYTHFRVHSHVFSNRWLVAVSNGGRSSYSGFPNYPRPQLPASNSNGSQRLNCSSSLTQNQSLSQSYFRLVAYSQSVRLGVKPLETHDQRFIQLIPCGHSPYVTPSPTRRWICLL
jgi:hypothetical protein